MTNRQSPIGQSAVDNRQSAMRVLVVAHTTGYQLRAFNDAAEALGIELVFATDRCHRLDDPWRDRAVAVRFHDVDASVRAIVDGAASRPIDGLMAVGDRPVVLAAHAAAALGLRWHSVAGALASTDKRRSRTTLAAAGLRSPQFSVLSVNREPTTRNPELRSLDPRPAFPVVLKPVGLSGSRGVIRANDETEFRAAFERIRALLARPGIRAARAGLEDEILVEQYVAGREFAIEGVMANGAFRLFALFDKPDPLDGPFFEETIYVTPSREPPAIQTRIVDHVARAAVALGLQHGPIHAECRVTAAGEVFVLEVAGRPIGGLCSRVLTFVGADDAEAVSLEGVLLEHALGGPVDRWRLAGGGAAVMMIPIPARGLYKGVDGEDDARSVPGVTDVRITAKPGQLLEPLPEAGSYLGFIFAHATTAAEAEATVREAHRRLTFAVSRELPLTR
jgi:biotin carboxylase